MGSLKVACKLGTTRHFLSRLHAINLRGSTLTETFSTKVFKHKVFTQFVFVCLFFIFQKAGEKVTLWLKFSATLIP